MYSTDTPVCELFASGKAQEASPARGEVAAILALDNAFISALRYVCQTSGEGHKKDVESSLLSIPRTEALALPIRIEQTTSEPTPI